MEAIAVVTENVASIRPTASATSVVTEATSAGTATRPSTGTSASPAPGAEASTPIRGSTSQI